MFIIAAPGDVLQLLRDYHDGVKLVLKKGTLLFVVAVYDESGNQVVKPGQVTRAPARIWLLPAGELKMYDLQRTWIEQHCKRLTIWQSASPV